jgi:hypothetical protein
VSLDVFGHVSLRACAAVGSGGVWPLHATAKMQDKAALGIGRDPSRIRMRAICELSPVPQQRPENQLATQIVSFNLLLMSVVPGRELKISIKVLAGLLIYTLITGLFIV